MVNVRHNSKMLSMKENKSKQVVYLDVIIILYKYILISITKWKYNFFIYIANIIK